jgi:hypothetical protein
LFFHHLHNKYLLKFKYVNLRWLKLWKILFRYIPIEDTPPEEQFILICILKHQNFLRKIYLLIKHYHEWKMLSIFSTLILLKYYILFYKAVIHFIICLVCVRLSTTKKHTAKSNVLSEWTNVFSTIHFIGVPMTFLFLFEIEDFTIASVRGHYDPELRLSLYVLYFSYGSLFLMIFLIARKMSQDDILRILPPRCRRISFFEARYKWMEACRMTIKLN